MFLDDIDYSNDMDKHTRLPYSGKYQHSNEALFSNKYIKHEVNLKALVTEKDINGQSEIIAGNKVTIIHSPNPTEQTPFSDGNVDIFDTDFDWDEFYDATNENSKLSGPTSPAVPSELYKRAQEKHWNKKKVNGYARHIHHELDHPLEIPSLKPSNSPYHPYKVLSYPHAVNPNIFSTYGGSLPIFHSNDLPQTRIPVSLNSLTGSKYTHKVSTEGLADPTQYPFYHGHIFSHGKAVLHNRKQDRLPVPGTIIDPKSLTKMTSNNKLLSRNEKRIRDSQEHASLMSHQRDVLDEFAGLQNAENSIYMYNGESNMKLGQFLNIIKRRNNQLR